MHNSYGEYFRITTFGESHGVGIGVVIDGCPAGIEIRMEKIQKEMDAEKIRLEKLEKEKYFRDIYFDTKTREIEREEEQVENIFE